MSQAFLPSEDLEQIQADLEESLFDQGNMVDQYRRTRGKDAIGAVADTWSMVDSDLPALISVTQGRRGEVAGGEVASKIAEVVLPAGKDVRPGDQLRARDGRIYLVDSTNEDDTLVVWRICNCTRLDQPNQDADVSG